MSADCYISLEPEWIGMAYWINTTNVTVKNIPFGYRMNQFTINPDGNLSSSLEFVYTDAWVPVYRFLLPSNCELSSQSLVAFSAGARTT